MLTRAAGLPVYLEPPLAPLPPPPASPIPRTFTQAVKPPLTSYPRQCHLQLSTPGRRASALDTVLEGHAHKISMAESLIEAAQQGWPKVAAFQVNKEELIRGCADERGGEWRELVVQRGDIS